MPGSLTLSSPRTEPPGLSAVPTTDPREAAVSKACARGGGAVANVSRNTGVAQPLPRDQDPGLPLPLFCLVAFSGVPNIPWHSLAGATLPHPLQPAIFGRNFQPANPGLNPLPTGTSHRPSPRAGWRGAPVPPTLTLETLFRAPEAPQTTNPWPAILSPTHLGSYRGQGS